jgi:serine/threonine-protein kinase ATR
MLCDPPVASAIVAYLYMQPDAQRQRGLTTLRRETKGVVLNQLLESINIPLIYKLALELGNEDPAVAAQAERALKNVERTRTGHAPSANVELGGILRNAIVGLLSHMNRGLHDAAHHRPLRDKQKIIRSLNAITNRVGRGILGFCPQVRSLSTMT